MKSRRFLSCITILTFITLAIFTGDRVFGASGEEVFKSRKCNDCHSVTKTQVKTFEDKLKKKGPDLWYAGSKYQSEWLVKFIEKPSQIRPLKYNSVTEKNDLKHPALSAGEAKAVADYLSSLKSKDVAQGVITKASGGIRGKIILEKNMACYGCHTVKSGASKKGGFTGPSLADAGERLQSDWVYSWIKNPDAFEPVRRMPNFSKYLNEAEIKTLAEYIISFK